MKLVKFVMMVRKKRKLLLLSGTLFLFAYLFCAGCWTHFFELDYRSQFTYPYQGDVASLVGQLRSKVVPDLAPINDYHFHFVANSSRCSNIDSSAAPNLVFLVKSAPEHAAHRLAIRRTWGAQTGAIQTVFLLGRRDDLQERIAKEREQFGDIVQANFTDGYFNNTLKTMMGLTWAVNSCPYSKYYMFVDDDYYVSTRNALDLIANVSRTHPGRLYLGKVFYVTPIRQMWSKWYITLGEYPYNAWPPFINAGAYILSADALIDMYYASFYTKHFRFDDIYLALLALKSGIQPFHSDRFYNAKEPINSENYKYVVATHGYSDPKELETVWTKFHT